MDPEIKRVLGQDTSSQDRTFQFQGCELITQYLPCSKFSDTLIVRFHGALNREKRKLPYFQPNLKIIQTYAHQITLCDPTMMTRKGFNIGWYCGHEELDVQGVLKSFFKQIKEFLGIHRMIYLGSSSGGFAALHYSFFDAESIALVMVPQTNLSAYRPAALHNYLKKCWSGKGIDDLSDKIVTDMTKLYASGNENSVIYIQSPGDLFHASAHMVPLLNAVYANGQRENSKFLVVSDYWGVVGHSGAITKAGYISWLIAAISAKTIEVLDLLNAYAVVTGRLGTTSKSIHPAVTIATKPENNFNSRGTDLASQRLADLLRDFHLRQPLEG
jgi:hypothetical protein